MDFNKHFNLAGQHAFLRASYPHWARYDEDKLVSSFLNAKAAQRGVEEHDLAHRMIRLRKKAPASKKSFDRYVNDAIGYRMSPEQILYYSDNCFGTADAISFDIKKGLLRIHDLKTGVIPGKVEQLEIYAAIFCLEYGVKPFEIEIEMRIYQNDEVKIWQANPDDITHLMDRIKTFDKIIEEIKSRG